MPAHSSHLQLQLCMIIKLCVSPKLDVGWQINTRMTTAIHYPLGLGEVVRLPQGPWEADTVLNGLPWIDRALKIHIRKHKIKVTCNLPLQSVSLVGLRVLHQGTTATLVLLLLPLLLPEFGNQFSLKKTLFLILLKLQSNASLLFQC